MLMGRDDKEGALRVFQSCWWLISILCADDVLLFRCGAVYAAGDEVVKR